MAVSEPDAMVMGFVFPAGTFFITGFRQKVQKPKTPSRVTFHGRAILRHGPFFSREAASEGGVLRAVFCGEVSGRHVSPFVMEIWAMQDDGPPSGRCAMSALAQTKN